MSPGTLTENEIRALFDVMDKRNSGGRISRCKRRNAAMYSLMYGSGLRRAEVCSLRLGDVDLINAVVYVHGKGGKKACVPLSRQVIDRLYEWEKIRNPECKHYFHSFKNKPIAPHYLYDYLKKIAVKAGVIPARVHPHVLRHTFASEMLRKGFDIRQVQDLMRHERLSSTQIYLHTSPQEIADKMRTVEMNGWKI